MQSWSEVPGVSYIAEYLTSSEQAALDEALSSRPWKMLRDRSLQNWGGLPHARGMVPVALPNFLNKLSTRLASDDIFPVSAPPNHVLVNRYQPGQGILPHTDGPAYKPVAAIISLRAHVLFDLHALAEPTQEGNASRSRIASIWLAPGSLLVMRDPAYSELHHGIEPRSMDDIDDLVLNAAQAPPPGTQVQRAERVSLTLRRASKTLRMQLRLGKR